MMPVRLSCCFLALLCAPVWSGEPERHQLYYGYGAISRVWVAQKVADSLVSGFGGTNSGGNSRGVHQIGYNLRVKDGWMLHVARTEESFSDGESMVANLVGVRREYRHGDQVAIYWGVASGRATYDFSHTDDGKYTAVQLDLGVRFIRGPWFAFGNLGAGDAGSVGLGVGVSL